MPEQHPLVQAIGPLIERLNAELVDPADARADDVPLEWDGKPVVAVRLPAKGGVQGLLAEVADELGGPLNELPRSEKQQAVLMLEARGAFEFRKSAEIVAEALGVTRFTVYNYLNRAR
ncbi:helix-turn-helix domain-containing protein [Kribbella sp. NPDC004875]|uniref:helix-turn-helix domain-containing protein n=1 Tax=Kribbella sp. NPDC004875 TaxID=3364107 RepID=UPI00369FC3D1